MALPDAVQGETGRTFSITWENSGDLSSATITGLIETIPGPEYVSREVSGTLAFVSYAAPSSVFTWVIDDTDTETDGDFTVEFTASTGPTVMIKSQPEPWKVVRTRTPVVP